MITSFAPNLENNICSRPSFSSTPLRFISCLVHFTFSCVFTLASLSMGCSFHSWISISFPGQTKWLKGGRWLFIITNPFFYSFFFHPSLITIITLMISLHKQWKRTKWPPLPLSLSLSSSFCLLSLSWLIALLLSSFEVFLFFVDFSFLWWFPWSRSMIQLKRVSKSGNIFLLFLDVDSFLLQMGGEATKEGQNRRRTSIHNLLSISVLLTSYSSFFLWLTSSAHYYSTSCIIN